MGARHELVGKQAAQHAQSRCLSVELNDAGSVSGPVLIRGVLTRVTAASCQMPPTGW